MKKIIPILALFLMVAGCSKQNCDAKVSIKEDEDFAEYWLNDYGDTVYNPIRTYFGEITFQQIANSQDTTMNNFYWPRQEPSPFYHIKDTTINEDTIHIYYCWSRDCWIARSGETGIIAGDKPEIIIDFFCEQTQPKEKKNYFEKYILHE